MRIIGGKYRGRKIKYPEKASVRPTKDRIRESVFNMIAQYVPGARVLDLFAGSGAYGLEALSRGAASSCFVDSSKDCVDIIRENCEALDTGESAKVIGGDALSFIKRLNDDKERFDIVFSDPPFNMGMAKKILKNIIQYDILNGLGLLVLEHSTEEVLPEVQEEESFLSIFKEKTYKNIIISVYVRK